MKKIILSIVVVCALAFAGSSGFAGSLEEITGKWTYAATNENGQAFTQILEIKKDKFTFVITDSDKNTILFAQGDVKVETFHSINSVTFSHIEGGASRTDLNPVDDDRQCVYSLDDNKLTIAVDFDKKRDREARIEVYTRKS